MEDAHARGGVRRDPALGQFNVGVLRREMHETGGDMGFLEHLGSKNYLADVLRRQCRKDDSVGFVVIVANEHGDYAIVE
jgi:hypothetical protein